YISRLIVDGDSIVPTSSYTFENVNANHTIHAMFANITHQLSISVIGNGTVQKNPDLPVYNYGSEVELLAIPETGWTFVEWSGDTFANDNPLRITMNRDKNITAKFILPGWQRLKDITTLDDKNFKDGAALAYFDSTIYAFQGGNSKYFYAYKLATDTWICLCSIPFTRKENGKFIKSKVKAGGTLTVHRGNIYAFKGGNTCEFWCYQPDSNKWVQMRSIPETTFALAKPTKVKVGAALVVLGDSIYAFKGGNTNEFWMYVPNENQWYLRKSLVTPDNKKIKGGGSLTVYNDTIYALVGSNTNYFYAYVPDTWIRKPDVRFGSAQTIKRKVKNGAALTSFNGKIYALKGGGTKDVGCYDVTTFNWYLVETLPGVKKIKGGAGMVNDNQSIYIIKGGNTKEFYKYTPTPENLKLIKQISQTADNIKQKIYPAYQRKVSIISILPNFSTKSVTFRYMVPIAGNVTIKLYNAAGQLIKILIDDHINPGSYTTTLTNIASGVYFLKYESAHNKAEVKLTVR
ncbi:MAG: T9SS type A sorting domain-containing protein, partial [candidate division WOR-3 bacterium]|nr:T9SS type A sorting domain-containing protein [candidate division WOR-3 bacterium]